MPDCVFTKSVRTPALAQISWKKARIPVSKWVAGGINCKRAVGWNLAAWAVKPRASHLARSWPMSLWRWNGLPRASTAGGKGQENLPISCQQAAGPVRRPKAVGAGLPSRPKLDSLLEAPNPGRSGTPETGWGNEYRAEALWGQGINGLHCVGYTHSVSEGTPFASE